jgi:hypothetical protein
MMKRSFFMILLRLKKLKLMLTLCLMTTDASPEARRTLEAAIKYVKFTSSSSFISFVILKFH